MSIVINDCVPIVSINFETNNIIKLISYSKIDIFINEKLYEVLESQEGENIGISIILKKNIKYNIMFENKKIFDIIINDTNGLNICTIVPYNSKNKPFKIYKNIYIYFKSDGSVLYVYEK